MLSNREFIFALDRFELLLLPKIVRNRNKFIKQAAKSFEKTGDISNRIIIEHTERVEQLLAAHYKPVTDYFGKQVAKKSHGAMERKAMSMFDAVISEWITTQALAQARTISQTDLKDVQSVIEDAMLEGEAIPTIAKSITKVTGLSAYRAAVVARTETHGAATYSAHVRVQEIQTTFGVVMEKAWVATKDARTRDAHASMDANNWIPVDEKFYVGGEYLDRAGEGNAANAINCRCQIIYREK
jgi:hypothetical protein